MHAQVRRLLLGSGRWDVEAWGLPINQADMAAMTHTEKRSVEYFIEGMSRGNGAREAFAESFGTLLGGGSYLDNPYMMGEFRRLFPNTLRWVQSLLEDLPE